jgi:FkbM family methyltransferase
VVVDVGANIGFFTLQFASWVNQGGRVIALEPEPANCGHLRRAVGRSGFAAVVEIVEAAAAETTGEALLELSSVHPADHRLGTRGVRVAMTTIDELLAARDWAEVSLIKIDVQGAEARVLAGARQTLERCRPALFLEVNDEQLCHYGSSARALLTECTDRGYTVHALGKDAVSAPLTLDQALARGQAPRYFDALLLPAGGPLRRAKNP